MKQQQISSEQTLVNGSQIDYNSYNYNGFGDRTCGVENVTHIFDVNYPDANTIRKTSDSLTKAFLSDTRGNLIQIKERRIPTLFFEYDTDNNMIGAEINGTNWTFRYNSQNQMYYSKIVDEYDCVIDERFYIYDGLDCIAETDTDGEILREYIRIGNVGGIVAEIRHNDTTCAPGYESGTFYYHYNHRGDVIAVSSHNGGSIIFKADYDAYGKITRIDSGSFAPRYTFSTKRYFKELGLYYYGYRWYLPELGRWTTKDPIGLASGDFNFFKFVRNNSVYYFDLRGLKWNLCNAGSLRKDFDKVKGTNVGEGMYEKIDDFEHTVSIIEVPGLGDAVAGIDEKGNHYIKIDPDYHPNYDDGTEEGYPASTIRIIAHEIAHQAYGPNQKKAIHYENLVAEELGDNRHRYE